MQQYKHIAIIGSGISGLTAAHLLQKRYRITLFEANDYIGGHTHTINVKADTGDYAIDTGFIVFNYQTYPLFTKLLNALNVKVQKSDMSFSFSSKGLSLEYAGGRLPQLFAQKRNFIRPKFYQLLYDIYRFSALAKNFDTDSHLLTVNDFLMHYKFSTWFKQAYLTPMIAAIWSMPPMNVETIPIHFIIDFYRNHGLLNFKYRPAWYVIKGGSKCYIDTLVRPFAKHIQLNTPVHSIIRDAKSVQIRTATEQHTFDAVVIACHSDQALKLLATPSAQEYAILGNIPYTNNEVILHTDETMLPQHQAAWASWNYQEQTLNKTSLTYYMNRLQGLKSKQNFCVSVNPPSIAPEHIIHSFQYAHPLYTPKSVTAKMQHQQINGQQNTFYTGAYWGNGFHEDGVATTCRALADLGVGL